MKVPSQFNIAFPKSNIVRSNQSIALPIFLALAFVILISDPSFAGTGGTELQGVLDKVMALAKGTGGKLAAAVAFCFSVIGAVRGNIMAFGSGLATAIVTGVGPEVFTSGVTALI